jgi:S-adenosylmethionine hydrolase
VAVDTPSGSTLVGPDNGLLSMAWKALGGAARAVEITAPDVILRPTSHTFHGRDVFAPAAAHLAAGGELSALGPDVDVDSLARVELPKPVVTPGSVRSSVLSIDRFGNVQLSAREEDLERAGLAEAEELVLDADDATLILKRARTFSDVRPGEAALISDSVGRLAAAVNGESLAKALLLKPGDPVVIGRVG